MAENGKWRNRIIETVQMRVGDLAVNKYNPKVHPASQETRVEAVLEKFGIVDSLIAWRSDRNNGQWTIFDGHLRQKLDPDQVWTVHKTSLRDEEVDELVFYFDPLAGMSLHDEAKMAALMQDLGDVDGVLGEMLEELAEGVGLAFGGSALTEAPEPQLDRAAELQEVWRVKRGQVWQVGRHRLMCGDSTCAEDVGRLMGNEKAALLATDPPYNVGIEYGRGVNDAKAAIDYEQFSRAWFGIWRKGSEKQIVTPGYYNLASWARFFGEWYHVAPWTKTNSMTRGHVSRFACFEPILFYGKAWRRERPNDVFNFPVSEQRMGSDTLTELHPCPKPLPMWADLIGHYTNDGDMVADAFLGSGTTLVACEQTARIGYGMEIEPKYCAVSLDRLQRLGLKPRLVER